MGGIGGSPAAEPVVCMSARTKKEQGGTGNDTAPVMGVNQSSSEAEMNSSRLTVGIVCGGQNLEHEVYLLSSVDVQSALDPGRFDVVVLGIAKAGDWHFSRGVESALQAPESLSTVALNLGMPVVHLAPGGRVVARATGECLARIDVFFTVTMDPVQGLFESLGVPYVGTGLYGFASGMDKDVAKRLLREGGFPVAPSITLRRDERVSYYDAAQKLGTRVFVKPCRLGNSIGVSEAGDEASFEAAVENAFRYDRKVLVEQAIEGREVECAVLGDGNPTSASALCEIVNLETFFTHEVKSSRQNVLRIPADVDPEHALALRAAALEIYRLLECEGMGRVDFFLREDGSYVVNEINVAPGLKRGYPYPRMWEASGVSYEELMTRLVESGLERHRQEQLLEI